MPPHPSEASLSARRTRLIELRERAGLSQGKVGELVRRSRSAVANLEAGKSQLNDFWVAALSRLYGCEPWELYEEAPRMTDVEREMVKRMNEMSPERREILMRLAAEMAEKSGKG